MSSPEMEHLSLETEADSDTPSSIGSQTSTDDEVTEDRENSNPVGRAIEAIDKYLAANSPIYPMLQSLRLQGWESEKADRYFSEMNRKDGEDPEKASDRLESRMTRIAKDMQTRTNAFKIKSQTKPKRILDLSVTPGAFLAYALERYPKAHALAFNLPEEEGGFAPRMEENEAVRIQNLDITMLIADMGVTPDEVPESDPDAGRYRYSPYFRLGRGFDLAICDNTIEPTEGMFRGSREYRRRLLTQLVLGLENLRDGGTMIVHLHKLERIQSIRLLLEFKRFANLTVFKHHLWTGKLASFYMVATEVRSTSQRARDAVQEWKREWKVVTMHGADDWRLERDRLAACGGQGVEGVLNEFGPTLVRLGSLIWQEQINALVQADW